MFLATTADQRYWKKDEKILFLGEWCKRYSKKKDWENLNYEVLPYHWDDRKKLYEDYLYLDKIYERYLNDLSNKLNKIHNVNHSIRYWRIIIGPWLKYFIEILFDRYTSIKAAIKSDKVSKSFVSKIKYGQMTPNDLEIFNKLFPLDEYNQYLYNEIILYLKEFSFENINIEQSINISNENINKNSNNKFIESLLNIYTKIITNNINKVVFVSCSLSNLDKIKLQLLLKQAPSLDIQKIDIPIYKINEKMRKCIIFHKKNNEFENLLNVLIPEQIPRIYIEGFDDCHKKSLSTYPKNPKIIFTSTAYFADEGFKFWTAYEIEKKAKLIISQHGGLYGSSQWSSYEDHEFKICDYFFSWGWREKNNNKILPKLSAKLIKTKRKIQYHNKNNILLIESSFPRYAYLLYCSTIGPQYLKYFEEQTRFIKAISPDIKKHLLVRLYFHDYGWGDKELFNKIINEQNIYRGSKSMYECLGESRLAICTYNGTNYLETFVANYPTIMFWNPKYWELREEAKPYYEQLKSAEILFDNPEKAAQKVNEIYNDPQKWWNQDEVQDAKNNFCEYFARTDKNWIYEWKKTFKDILKEK